MYRVDIEYNNNINSVGKRNNKNIVNRTQFIVLYIYYYNTGTLEHHFVGLIPWFVYASGVYVCG